MARFCTKCGRPLKEGEVCNCTAQNAGGAQNAGAQQSQPGGQQNYQQSQPGGTAAPVWGASHNNHL